MIARSGDAPPQQGVAVDLTRFQDCMDLALPLIDFGCGHGAQTRFLAQHFRRVLGVDIAPAAIKRAIALGQPANVSYRVLDALRPDEAQELHDEVGDANIYMRGRAAPTIRSGSTKSASTRFPSCSAAAARST